MSTLNPISSPPRVHMESIQTVVPIKPSDPTITNSCNISLIPPQNLEPNIIGRRFNLVLCYNKSNDEDSGWLMAGWIKESLSIALCEMPMLAGRLRVRESEGGGQDLGIVLNDSGVRLVEARVEMKLVDFVDHLEEEREATLGQLVFWEDVVDHNIDFSPLFYVQVTNFSCGGYSIGISCSLVVADPFTLTAFLKKWANTHTTLPTAATMPISYLPKLRKLNSSNATALVGNGNTGINTKTNPAKSLIFHIPTKILILDNSVYKNLAVLCIHEAERKIGVKMGSKFSLFVKEPYQVLKVETCSTECPTQKTICTVNVLEWDDVLGDDEIWFNEENKPAYVSCWINSFPDEGSVIIVAAADEPSSSSAMQIIVTFPNH